MLFEIQVSVVGALLAAGTCFTSRDLFGEALAWKLHYREQEYLKHIYKEATREDYELGDVIKDTKTCLYQVGCSSSSMFECENQKRRCIYRYVDRRPGPSPGARPR